MDPANAPCPYINRELSWLDFNGRVLEEAMREDNPVLERLKFLAITASNLDEFFMVRVSMLKEQERGHVREPDPAGLTPRIQLEQIQQRAHDFVDAQYTCLAESIAPELNSCGLHILRTDQLTRTQLEHIHAYFHGILSPVLTPMAVDPARPFPFLGNQSLNIAVRMEGEHFAVVQVPSILPRLLELPSGGEGRTFILLENIITLCLDQIFEVYDIEATCQFRVTRGSEMDIDEEAEDLLREIQKNIKKRRRGRAVRMELSAGCDGELRAFLVQTLEVGRRDVYEIEGPLDLAAFMKLAMLPGADALRLPPIEPVPAGDFAGCEDYFEHIRERDRMVHLPYESFDDAVAFVEAAANDPDVLAIKQTLYRVGSNSPVVAALIKAAENGKQVTVLVELKARFDEENNIHWALKLEQAGCHVIYGLSGLKTHCKILLVVRREKQGIRRYLHMSTGNYNAQTARLYTDIGFFTARESFGGDASALFNHLTGYSQAPQYNKLIVAPDTMRDFLTRMVDEEARAALEGRPAGITIKVNSLLDAEVIAHLYAASRAGVRIELIVRGICALVPGVEGCSENIRVISIVGQLLEHSRIYVFENGGRRLYYLGSADVMPRNLDRRVELLFPVEDEALCARLEAWLELMLADSANARLMLPDGSYRPPVTLTDDGEGNAKKLEKGSQLRLAVEAALRSAGPEQERQPAMRTHGISVPVRRIRRGSDAAGQGSDTAHRRGVHRTDS